MCFISTGAAGRSTTPRSWRQVRARLSAQTYDLIHAQWGQSALLALPKALPLVVTFRGSDVAVVVGSDGRYLLSGRLLRAMSRSIARIADEVIVVSESLARELPGGPYHVIPSGLNLDLFRPIPQSDARRQLGLSPERR